MAEHLRTDGNQSEIITGQHIDIHLGDREMLMARLAAKDRPQVYIRSFDEDTLPYPAKSVTLESWNGEDPRMPTIQADISFRPTDLENAPGIWPDGFFWQLYKHIQTYGIIPHTREHDPLALYATIDNTYCMRVALGALPDECSITITSERLSTVEQATHNPLPPVSDKNIEPVDRLLYIATALGIAIDELRTTFGKPPRYPKRYILEAHQPYTRDSNTSSSLVLAPREQPNIPESEMITAELNGLVDIGGAFAAKQRLEELAAIINDPEGAAMYGVKGGHFLLHGPPGGGKSSLVEALAQEIGANMWTIRSTDIINKYVGESGKNIVDTLKKAKAAPGKLVLFFDEFDSLARKGAHGTAERIDVRKVLNTEIEDIVKNHPNIVIAAATNVDLDDLESSLIRSGRLEPIGVPLPNERERIDIWGIVLMKSIASFSQSTELVFDEMGHQVLGQEFLPYADNINLEELAAATEGMTGADFEVILTKARQKCFLHYQKTGQKLQVQHADLLRIIQTFGR